MSSRDEADIGNERCLLLQRHAIAISVDKIGGVHLRIRDEAGALLSHLAATPTRARSIAAALVRAADRLDPPAAASVTPIGGGK